MLLYFKFIISCLQETLISCKVVLIYQKTFHHVFSTVVMLKRHVIMPTLTFILCNQCVVLSKRHVVLLKLTLTTLLEF